MPLIMTHEADAEIDGMQVAQKLRWTTKTVRKAWVIGAA